MEKNYQSELWRPVVFNFDFVNETRIEISNFGRVKTFNKLSDGNIIKGSTINGYKIIRLKFFKARETEMQQRLDYLRQQVMQLNHRVKSLKTELQEACAITDLGETLANELTSTTSLLATLKESITKKMNEDLKSRTIYYQVLIHRLVAEYFMPQPSPQHTVVAHIDYDKQNNHRQNLKWMTPEENYLHQRFSPNVIASKAYLDGRRKEDARSTKLSVTKVMLLKKLLNEGKPIRQLVKQFKVTETQIVRIRKGENWAEVQAAP